MYRIVTSAIAIAGGKIIETWHVEDWLIAVEQLKGG